MIQDTFQYMISKVIPGLSGFFMVVLILRLVGSEEYGRYAVIFSAVSMGGAFAVGWLSQAQLRFLSLHLNELSIFKDAVKTGLKLSVALALGVIAVVLLLMNDSFSLVSLFLGPALGASYMIHATRLSAFQSTMQPLLVVKMELIRSTSSLLLPVLIILMIGPNHIAVLAGITLAYAVSVLWYTPLRESSVKLSPEEQKKRRSLLRKFWSFGWPLSLWLGGAAMFPVIDRFLIQHFYNFEHAGTYASLYDLSIRSYSLFFFPITLAAHPRIMAAWNSGNHRKVFSIIRMALLAQFVLFIPFIFLCAIAAPTIMALLIPGTHASMSRLIVPLAIGGFLWQILLLVHKPLEITGNTRMMLFAIAGALIVNLLINYWGLPRYGTIAAAYAYIAAASFYILICSVFNFAYFRSAIYEKDNL